MRGRVLVWQGLNASGAVVPQLHSSLWRVRYFIGVTVCYLTPAPSVGSGVSSAPPRWCETRRKSLLTKKAPAACFSLSCKADTSGWLTVCSV